MSSPRLKGRTLSILQQLITMSLEKFEEGEPLYRSKDNTHICPCAPPFATRIIVETSDNKFSFEMAENQKISVEIGNNQKIIIETTNGQKLSSDKELEPVKETTVECKKDSSDDDHTSNNSISMAVDKAQPLPEEPKSKVLTFCIFFSLTLILALSTYFYFYMPIIAIDYPFLFSQGFLFFLSASSAFFILCMVCIRVHLSETDLICVLLGAFALGCVLWKSSNYAFSNEDAHWGVMTTVIFWLHVSSRKSKYKTFFSKIILALERKYLGKGA